MEIIIVICLLIVIALLLHDKIVIQKKCEQKSTKGNINSGLPDVMGHSKPPQRHALPNSASDRQAAGPLHEADNFEVEIKEEDFRRQIPQEELDEIFSAVPVDLEEEEEEWKRYEFADGDDGLAQGVTFEELTAVGMVLNKEVEDPSMQLKAAETVHKIQGTELFALLENSTENASRRIAELLDSRLALGAYSGSSDLRNDIDGFDIGEFV
jgi:hypothetical protein